MVELARFGQFFRAIYWGVWERLFGCDLWYDCSRLRARAGGSEEGLEVPGVILAQVSGHLIRNRITAR